MRGGRPRAKEKICVSRRRKSDKELGRNSSGGEKKTGACRLGVEQHKFQGGQKRMKGTKGCACSGGKKG